MKNNLAPAAQRTVLSVEDRVMAALELAKFEGSTARISVSIICKQAGVNRSNLYASHPDLVAHIQSLKIITNKKPNPSKDFDTLRAKINSLEKQNKALLFLLVEMSNRLRMIQRQMARSSRPKASQLPKT